mgnify:CR=1 FL=1
MDEDRLEAVLRERLGAGRRGVDMGPSALRVANLNARLHKLGFEVDDLGNVQVEQPESSRPGPASARYLQQIAAEKKRADDLLHVIFPDTIVAELKESNSVTPRRMSGPKAAWATSRIRIGVPERFSSTS